MDTMAEAAEKSRQLDDLYDQYLYLERRFNADLSKGVLMALDTVVNKYSKLLEETKQEVNLRKK